MSRNHIYSLVLGLCSLLSPGWLSAQSQIEPFFRLGNTSFGLDQIPGMGNTGAFGSQIGANYLHGINDNLQLGTGLSINSFGAQLFADSVVSTYSASLEAPYSWDYNRTAAGRSVDESVRMSALQIPVFVNYFFGDGDFRPYIRLGAALNVPLSATYQNVAGSVSYTGEGELTTDNGRVFTVEFFDLVKEEAVDFESGRNLLSNPQDLEINSTFFSLLGTVGFQYALSPKLNASVGLHFNQNTNVSAYNPAEYVFSETGGAYTSLVGRSSRASTRFIGLHAGVGINLGESPDDCIESQPIPVRFQQLEANRRQPNRPDPEFANIAREVINSLSFQPNRWKVRYDRISNALVYCSNEGAASEITVGMRASDFLRLDPFASGYKGGNFEVVLAVENKKDVVLQLTDADTDNPIQNAPYELSMGSTIVSRGTLNSGDRLLQLYDHPLIAGYTLRISHQCYKEEIFLTRSDIQRGRKDLNLTSSGKPTELSLPMAGSVSGNISIQGELRRSGNSLPISGSINQQGLTLYAGCGEAPTGKYSLNLEKPRGYNLSVGSRRSSWRDASVQVGMTNNQADEQVSVEPLPTYNLFYVDISEATNRNLIRTPLMQEVTKLRENGDDFLIFLSNGRNPITATTGSEYTNLMREFVRQLPETPTASTDRALMLEQMDLSSIRPDRKLVTFHFYVSQSVYESSREQLINELTDAFGENGQFIELIIYTDFEVPATSRLNTNRYRMPIKYVRLR